MPLHHPAAFRLAGDLDRYSHDPTAIAARAATIREALDEIDLDHPAASECVVFIGRARSALDRMCQALDADYPFVAALDLQHLREAVHEAVSVSRGEPGA